MNKLEMQNNLIRVIESKISEYKYDDGIITLDHVKCNDGFIFSMQFGRGMYCDTYGITSTRELLLSLKKPNELNFEVGYPTEYEKLLDPYKTEDEAIYAKVPMDVILEVIIKHGGVKELGQFILG